jgi:DUF971 family protein
MTASARTPHRATEIRLHKGSRVVEVLWEDRTRRRYAFATLRAHCRCTECRRLALRNGSETVVTGGDVEITEVRPIGAYALQFVFSDGHARGVFPFRYLRELEG